MLLLRKNTFPPATIRWMVQDRGDTSDPGLTSASTMQAGAEYGYRDSDGRDAFWHAAYKSNVPVLRVLWDMRPAGWVPASDSDNRSALHAAIHWNQLEAVHFLLRELPAEFILEHMHPQQQLDSWGHSAEHDAYTGGNEEIADKLRAWLYRHRLSPPA